MEAIWHAENIEIFHVNNSGGKEHTHTQNVSPSSDQTDDKLVAGLKSRFSFRLTCQHLLLSLLFPACNAEGRNDVLLRSPEQSGRSERESAAECYTGVAHKKKKKKRISQIFFFPPRFQWRPWRHFQTQVTTMEFHRG